jgi:FdhD protein
VTRALQPIDIARVSRGERIAARDVAAVEEPLEIRLNGTPFVVIMRTPGADRDLTAGFLFAERIIAGPDDLGTIRHCVDPNGEAAPNVINVTLAGHAATNLDAILSARREVTTTSACGVCGRKTIDDLMIGVESLPATWKVSSQTIRELPAALRAAQDAFTESGGIHAAGLFDREGRLVASAEDVGRHNAVDKVVGAQVIAERMPLEDRVLFVSGRASYEIMQKALVARIPIIGSVSAPSSLAIDLARAGNATLLGFVRGGSFNVYTGIERVDGA